MFKQGISEKTPRRLLFLFEILAFLLIIIYQKTIFDKYTLIAGTMLIMIIYLSNYLLTKISSGDSYILLIVSMLMSIGIIMIFRIDRELGTRQIMWLSLGILCFYLTYLVFKYINIWDKLFYLYIGASYFLFAVTFFFGAEKYGAVNWVHIAGVSIQPAEVIKLLIVFILASYYSNHKRFKNKKYSSYIIMAIMYSFIGLLFLQKDLGMALIFYIIYLTLQFIYEKNRPLILVNLLLFAISGTFGYFKFNHVRIRVMTWLNPWKYMDNQGYQITQSLFAIAEGGFFGKGIGLGHPYFIPLSYNDFIFSAICEEMGIFTGIGIIMLFMILVYRGFKIGISQENIFLRIMALGVSIIFGIQTIIIIGGVIKLIPLTGITLPFISYGGSSMLTSFVALGILQVASEERIEG